jgi:pimeloyl-ACP methyl ester carboxylesterase
LYEGNAQLKVVLMGHSTGSQIVLRYARTGKYRTRIVGGILQGAVSDRDYYAIHLPNLAESLVLANELRTTNRGHHWMPVDAYPDAPITADRFWSLLARG